MDYIEALDYLRDRTKFGINLGLKRIETLLGVMGNPQQKDVKYVHIAGTNGKGSTALMLHNMLGVAYGKCGFFSSPHLHSYCERMKINGENISEADVATLITDIAPMIEKLVAEGLENPTEFETNTAMALKYFTDKKCPYAVMEVGMGGAIDSTNVIIPEVAIITNVSLDHIEYLGNNVVEIARVKAGIIKEGVPLICSCEDESVIAEILAIAAEKKAKVYLLGRDFKIIEAEAGQVSIEVDGVVYEGLPLNLKGRHQLKNAACAIVAAHILGVDINAMREGLEKSYWEGRFEEVYALPRIILDGAHNEAGIRVLTEALDDYCAKNRIVAVIGMLADKDRENSLEQLMPYLEHCVITKVDNPRAGAWQEIGAICEENFVPYTCIEANELAINHAFEIIASGEADMLLVAGSLYMLGDVRDYICGVVPDLPVVLASASPRRKELLEQVGLDIIVAPSDVIEVMEGMNPRETAMHNAFIKASDVAESYPDNFVIGADTIVVLNGEILGKPEDEADAFRMLKKLSARTHEVLTAVTVVSPSGEKLSLCEATEVYFKKMSDEEIFDYIATGEPMDKAGAYGIQGIGNKFVEKIRGDYNNVVGLPVSKIGQMIAELIIC